MGRNRRGRACWLVVLWWRRLAGEGCYLLAPKSKEVAMTDAVLFAYVPVFRHYLGRIAGLSERANTDQLESRLS
ncbi:hypothetical protein, partial [Xenorhabdus bovienii]|uniref:hypothetical protein n=1 Tax=Xenorhabdus bovienii TaxID=40576 RepID=UPI0021575499